MLGQTEWRQIVDLWKPTFQYRLDALFLIGSHAHGTHIPPTDGGIDDTDYLAIVTPEPKKVVGLYPFDHWTCKEGPLDITIYSWFKYIKLLRKGNPNVITTLWHPTECTHINSPPMERLLRERNTFCSNRIIEAFQGYIKGQVYKMEHCAGQGYLGAKRKALVEKFGYDTKNAAHAVRLYRMCLDYVQEGWMEVRRRDAEELKAIKRGEWPLHQVRAELDRLAGACRAWERGMAQVPTDDEAIDRLLLMGLPQGKVGTEIIPKNA